LPAARPEEGRLRPRGGRGDPRGDRFHPRPYRPRLVPPDPHGADARKTVRDGDDGGLAGGAGAGGDDFRGRGPPARVAPGRSRVAARLMHLIHRTARATASHSPRRGACLNTGSRGFPATASGGGAWTRPAWSWTPSASTPSTCRATLAGNSGVATGTRSRRGRSTCSRTSMRLS